MSKRFQTPHLFWWISIPGAFFIAILLVFYPNVIPLNNLGPLGRLLSNLVLNYRMFMIIGIWGTVIAHIYEAIIARRLCHELNIDSGSTVLWMIQTFILGFPSLIILKRYVRQQK